MSAYDVPDAALSPREDFLATMSDIWMGLGHPGTWWRGAERVAILEAARAARDCDLCTRRREALSPYTIDERHTAGPELSADLVDAVHRISTDPGRLSQRWYEELLAAGVTPEQTVEMVGLIGVLTIGDTLSRACGASRLAVLPFAVAGEPSREHAVGTTLAGAWVPMVDPDSAEGELEMIYGMVREQAGFVFNVVRSLTAVPDAMRSFFGAFMPHYTTHGAVENAMLTRPQMEVLAATTSGLNDCFY
ncbi:MAG: alkylhydroperoxidase-related (seleno)protein [Candidatus Binatia bacterium]